MDTVKKTIKVLLFLSIIMQGEMFASAMSVCTRPELQFFNTYVSTVINPDAWTASSHATILFGYKPVYEGQNIFKKENYLIRFSYYSKNRHYLVLKGDIQQVESPKTRGCWKTALYFTYDLENSGGYPEITTSEGVSVPLVGDNLEFKTCDLLSRTSSVSGSASHSEIITGTTVEGEQYGFWILYAKPNVLLKAFEGQRTKNAQTVFFETVGLNN